MIDNDFVSRFRMWNIPPQHLKTIMPSIGDDETKLDHVNAGKFIVEAAVRRHERVMIDREDFHRCSNVAYRSRTRETASSTENRFARSVPSAEYRRRSPSSLIRDSIASQISEMLS